MRYIENEDQKVLLAWIVAGLGINRDGDNLKGNTSYLFNNMIAKYTLFSPNYNISENAFTYMKENHDFDPERTYKRYKFYGKSSGLIYEHPVPALVIRKRLFEFDNPSPEKVRDVLQASGQVTVLIRDEDKGLSDEKLSRKMPDDWEWEDNEPYARYKKVGIEISDVLLKVDGAVYR